jgi:small subunit ribosomal protein S1
MNRIFVSHRELLGTWEENAARFSAGQTAAGVIRSIESYGIFIELTPNLAGLAELQDSRTSGLDLSPGRSATVYIKSIIPERMKIKLVLIDTYSQLPPVFPPQYFLDPAVTTHIDRWRYSPLSAGRVIETVFCDAG